MRALICPALLALATVAFAAEPAPGPGGRVMPGMAGAPGMPGPMGRLLMTYEVESLVVKPDDKASMARWAELGGLGYHVVASSPHSGGALLLLLERTGVPGLIQVPTVVAEDKDLTDAVRFKVAQIQQERNGRPLGVMPAQAPTAAATTPAAK